MYTNYKVLGKKERVVGEEAFKFYRRNAKHRDATTNNESKHLSTILNSIYSKVSKAAIENEGGVYAPGFFYIIPQPFPKKSFIKILQPGGGYRGTMNLHTDGLIYSLVFVNILPKNTYRIWDMTNSYFSNIRKSLSKTLKEYNPNYLFSLGTLRKIK